MAVVIEVAPLSRRWVALLVDGFAVLPFAPVLYGLHLIPNVNPSAIQGSPLALVLIYLLFVILYGTPAFVYFLLFEPITHGFTLGKRLVGIRVLEEGKPASVKACVIRDILRVVDYMPLSYLVGIASVLLDGKNRRLGDLAAGTVVARWPIREPLKPSRMAETVYPGSTRIPHRTAR